jgi:hypothetical protein
MSTLLERRQRNLNTEIQWLIQEVERLKLAVESGTVDPHGMTNMTHGIATHAQLADGYARTVEDLDDVTKYGPDGGR